MSIRRSVDSFARQSSRGRTSATCSESDNPRDHSSMLVELELNRIMMTFHSKPRSYQWRLLRNVNHTFIHRQVDSIQKGNRSWSWYDVLRYLSYAISNIARDQLAYNWIAEDCNGCIDTRFNDIITLLTLHTLLSKYHIEVAKVNNSCLRNGLTNWNVAWQMVTLLILNNSFYIRYKSSDWESSFATCIFSKYVSRIEGTSETIY